MLGLGAPSFWMTSSRPLESDFLFGGAEHRPERGAAWVPVGLCPPGRPESLGRELTDDETPPVRGPGAGGLPGALPGVVPCPPLRPAPNQRPALPGARERGSFLRAAPREPQAAPLAAFVPGGALPARARARPHPQAGEGGGAGAGGRGCVRPCARVRGPAARPGGGCGGRRSAMEPGAGKLGAGL